MLLTLGPDPTFLFPSPENEFRGELLSQRWTCGEKISSCEGAAGLQGTRIKVSTQQGHSGTVTPLPHMLAMGQGPHVLQLLLEQLLPGERSLSGAHAVVAGFGNLGLLAAAKPPVVNPGREGFQLPKFGLECRYLNPCLPLRCHPSRVAQIWVFRSLPALVKEVLSARRRLVGRSPSNTR